MMPTQLYARLKRSSKYHYQATSSMPFPVTVGGAGCYDAYLVYGNGNRYRLSDVTFFVHHNDRFVPLIPSRHRAVKAPAGVRFTDDDGG